MANITQTIPALTAGISQQPDEKKIPGQVKDMVNAIPDVTQGLLKRPAGKFVASLSDGSNNSTTNGRWFHYYRDENEQYIGQIAQNGVIKMWDCLTGAEKTVVNAIGNNTYLTHTNDEDIQTLTLNDFTYLNNRSITTEMDTTTEPLGNFQKEIFIELKSLSYAKQYAVNVFDDTSTSTVSTVTRISVDLQKSSNNYCDSSGAMVARNSRASQSTRCDESAGDGRDAFAPNVGTRIFSITDGASLTDDAVSGSHTYTVDVKDSGGNSVNRGVNLYFRIATTGQSVPFTTGSGTSQTTTYQARYTTTHDLLHGGEGWQEGDNFTVFMKDAIYNITVDSISTSVVQANLALVRPQPTPFDTETTITAESILGDIRKGLTGSATATTGNGFTVTQIGTGLHVTRSAVFNASTPVGELLNVVASKVNDVGDLPSQCKHGMVVEVVNSVAEEDNHYVKFFGNNDKDGEGTWEECAKPGRLIRLKRSKMPVLLIRTADGNFRLTELDGSTYSIGGVTQPAVPQWDDAIVGDDVTNPEPSFIGKSINKMLFFRNRFGILADENIVMSRPGDFTNFFGKSAIQLVASDPIDISASSEYPAILFDGIQVNTGLLLFSKNQQFMLTTDSDVFSPTTAKINALSTYNFNFATNPISLGTTVGFLDNAGKFSRFFEMTQIQREGEPEVLEQSAVVSRLFEKDLKLISNSRENSVIFFSEEGTSTLYGYRYFDNIRQRKLAAWFRWTLTGTIQYHCMQDDNLFVVVRNNNKDQLLKYSIKMDANTFAIAENRVHLDHLMSVTTASNTYNATTNKTTFPKPTGIESTSQMAAYDVDSGTELGRYGLVTINGSNLEIDGNWSSQTFLIGHQFTMEVKLPTIYYVTKDGESFRSDTRSSTIIHRVKFGFGPLGIYETTLSRTGRVDYTETFELTAADIYKANAAGIIDDNILRSIPIYDRNINAQLTLKSTHPAPATVHHMTWEGVYTNNNYQRV
ncbi:MAG: hypothetical protein CMC78_02385 [Flavobacteriaceae bacterium]|nr:hypothetical protein [Flavobacteriaceae bacterium]